MMTMCKKGGRQNTKTISIKKYIQILFGSKIYESTQKWYDLYRSGINVWGGWWARTGKTSLSSY